MGAFGTVRRAPAAALLLALALAGCVERRREEADVPPSELVSRDRPTPAHPLAIRFEDRVELVGYDLEPSAPAPGERATITWHWKTLRAVDEGFRLFTHVDDGRGGAAMNLDGEGPTRRGLPPDRWRAGEYVRDPQSFTVPPVVEGGRLVFHVGLWKGDRRLDVTRGPSDGSGRARAASVRVGAGAAAEVPELAVPRAAGITIDGRLDEPAWARAARTERFVDTMRGSPAPFEATARFAYDDRYLYVAFEVADTRLLASHTTHDDHLWEQDCVELFVTEGDGPGYVEMQVSPRAVTFDTRYASRRMPRPFGHVDYESGIEAAVVARGTVDDGEDDQGYVVEARMPFAALGAAAPGEGATLRANVYVMNKLERGMTAAAWSPPLVGDFHVPARFGRLTLR